jgi:hypothetical protein
LLKSVAKISNGISVAKIATEYPLLVVSIGLSVAKKLATTNLHPIFAVADSVAKLF